LILGACADAPLDPATERLQTPDVQALFARADGLPFSEAMAELGDLIFDDQELSRHGNQACNACHASAWGFTGPSSAVNAAGAVYEGSVAGAFGDRKPPSSAYATPAPIFHFSRAAGGLFVGGNFWDGRATGARLGNPAVEQAQGPFLNPAEQALRDEACVVVRVSQADYGALYRELWGNGIDDIVFPLDIDTQCNVGGERLAIDAANRALIQQEYDNIVVAIAVYEESHNQFSSKFDAARRGLYKFTRQEQQGLALFQGKAKCARCHPSNGQNALFTDFTYDNLGVPKNPQNPVYARDPDYVDAGLGGFLLNTQWAAFAASERGKMKVPTLRNVDLRPTPADVKAYMHNGVFKSLEEVVHFYNTRDALAVCAANAPRSAWGSSCWPAPEVPDNVNTGELGNLGLTAAEEAAIVAFLRTLSDGYLPGERRTH
jgi:cytochrome c peroxidase